MYRLLLISFFFVSFIHVQAQDLGVHFGHQIYGVFNTKQTLHGISIGLDIPRSGFTTPYGQLTVFLPKTSFEENIGEGTPKDTGDFFSVPANGNIRVNTFSLELGTMNYFGGAYDYGFSGMFHSSVRVLLMPQKIKLVDFDSDNYDFKPYPGYGGTGLAVNAIFGAGAKYTFEWGSLYALANFELYLFGDPMRFPSYYFDEFNSVSRFSFSTRIGIRRDLDFSKSGDRKQVRENNRREKQKW